MPCLREYNTFNLPLKTNSEEVKAKAASRGPDYIHNLCPRLRGTDSKPGGEESMERGSVPAAQLAALCPPSALQASSQQQHCPAGQTRHLLHKLLSQLSTDIPALTAKGRTGETTAPVRIAVPIQTCSPCSAQLLQAPALLDAADSPWLLLPVDLTNCLKC